MHHHTPHRVLLAAIIAVLSIAPFSAAQTIGLAPDATDVVLEATEGGGEILVVTVSEVRLDAVEIEGQQWAVVRVPGCHNLMRRGEPSLPFLTIEYLLGRSDGIELELIDVSVRAIDLASHGLVGVAPSKGHFGRDVDPETVPWSFAQKIYGSSQPYPAGDARVDGPFIAGPIRGQAAQIPVARWQPDTNRLTVVERARFQVTRSEGASNPRLRPDPPMTGLYDQVARRMVNYGLDGSRNNPFVETGRLLVITDDAFLDEIQPLVDWQIRVGYPTLVAPVSVMRMMSSMWPR